MKRERIHAALLAVAFMAVCVAAQAAKEPRMKAVYIFGYGASLTDSLVCQTQVQRVDSAWLDAHDLLVDRSLYSIQLQFYLEQRQGLTSPVCAVFFGTNERRMRKQWAKMKRRYEREAALRYRELTDGEFAFTPEEYKPIINGEDEATEVEQTPQREKAGKKAAKSQKEIRKGKKK